MQIQRDENPGRFVVKQYAPGAITINHDTHHSSVVITPTQLITDWRPQRTEDLQADDFNAILELKPEVVILGTGAQQHFPEPAIFAPLYDAQIGVEIMATDAACRTFNVLIAEGRTVVAALLI